MQLLPSRENRLPISPMLSVGTWKSEGANSGSGVREARSQ